MRKRKRELTPVTAKGRPKWRVMRNGQYYHFRGRTRMRCRLASATGALETAEEGARAGDTDIPIGSEDEILER